MPRLVALDMPWGDGFVRALESVWEAGDAACPLDPRLPAPAARALLAALRATHILGADGEIVARDGGVPVEPGDALVVATSGSSGRPRAAVLTMGAVGASAEMTSRRLEVDPGVDTWLACIPLSHVGGLGVVTRSLLTGTPLVVHAGFDAAAVEGAARRGATLVSLVAAALAWVDSSLFRVVLLGGAAPPSALPAGVVTTYGMTETCGGVFYDGFPLDGVEVSIGDAARGGPGGGRGPGGGSGGPGNAGEIFLRGPMLLRAYRDAPTPISSQGWFPTGDAGWVDEDGRLHVTGRISEVINTGGEKVWPAAVERALGLHPLIAEVAVSGRPDPEWGERVVAFVVPAAGAELPNLEEIRDFVAQSLPRWAAPRELVMLRELPRLESGKVARRLLGGVRE